MRMWFPVVVWVATTAACVDERASDAGAAAVPDSGGPSDAGGFAEPDMVSDTAELGDTRRPTPWLGDDVGVPALEILPQSERDAALLAAIRQASAPNLSVLVDTYTDWMARADGSCPVLVRYDDEEFGEVEAWEGNCTTEAGVRFQGSARFARAEAQPRPDGALRDRLHLQWTDSFRIEAPDGTSIQGDLYFDQSRQVRESSREFGVFMQGRFDLGVAWPDASLGWSMPFRGQIEGYVGNGIDQPWVYQQYSSTLASGPDGFVGSTFDELVFENYGACAQEPRGGFSLRHANGAWYDVVFDAVDSEGELIDPERCDGCASVWVQGVEQPAFCLPDGVMAELAAREVPW